MFNFKTYVILSTGVFKSKSNVLEILYFNSWPLKRTLQENFVGIKQSQMRSKLIIRSSWMHIVNNANAPFNWQSNVCGLLKLFRLHWTEHPICGSTRYAIQNLMAVNFATSGKILYYIFIPVVSSRHCSVTFVVL